MLKGRFVKRVLSTQATAINLAQVKYMASNNFTSSDWINDRGFTTTETALEYSQKLKHRFVDMKTRKNSKGNKKRKVQHPIHNKIIWGHYNNIVRELAHGYTEAVKEELS
ncbi:MAG: hypothetical protein BM557_01350 [Flavobacterium sp. MedPE-SWcel]|nr:MAG: hypothetical protein BM557_01350 [Flavobacterium sp. MedPE-SWcel]